MILLKGNRFLIEQEKPVSQTAGGIWLPDAFQEARSIGKVIAVGDTGDRSLMNKTVLFDLPAAQNVNFGELSGKLVFQSSIYAILN